MLHPLRHHRLQQDPTDADGLGAEVDDAVDFCHLLIGLDGDACSRDAVLVCAGGEVPGGDFVDVYIRLFGWVVSRGL